MKIGFGLIPTMERLSLFLLLFSVYSVYGNRYQTYNGYGKGYGKGYGDYDKGYGDYGLSGYKFPGKTYRFRERPTTSKLTPYGYPYGKSSPAREYASPSETSTTLIFKPKTIPSRKYPEKRYSSYGKHPSTRPHYRKEQERKSRIEPDFETERSTYRKADFERPEPSYTKATPRVKSLHFPKSPYDETSPGRASYFPRPPFAGFSRRDRDKGKMIRGLKKFYGQSAPKETVFFRKGDRTFRSRDPCVNLAEGEYVLDGRFDALFSYVDPQCYFVKCANKKAYLNQCSRASRNTGSGEGFCSHIDLEGYCGVSFHDAHRTHS